MKAAPMAAAVVEGTHSTITIAMAVMAAVTTHYQRRGQTYINISKHVAHYVVCVRNSIPCLKMILKIRN